MNEHLVFSLLLIEALDGDDKTNARNRKRTTTGTESKVTQNRIAGKMSKEFVLKTQIFLRTNVLTNTSADQKKNTVNICSMKTISTFFLIFYSPGQSFDLYFFMNDRLKKNTK